MISSDKPIHFEINGPRKFTLNGLGLQVWIPEIVKLFKSLSKDSPYQHKDDLIQQIGKISHRINLLSKYKDKKHPLISDEREGSIDRLYCDVIQNKTSPIPGNQSLDDLVARVFGSHIFREMIPSRDRGLSKGDRFFIKNWIAPKLLLATPELAPYSHVGELSNWIAGVILGTLTRQEMQGIKDEIDGISVE